MESYHNYVLRRLGEVEAEEAEEATEVGKIIKYDTGATRESDNEKLDIEGFLSPLVIEAYSQYMHFNRKLPDGTMRSGSDWQNGIPFNRLMRSMWRHFKDCWMEHRLWATKEGRVFALCGLLFNTVAYLHQVLYNDPYALQKALEDANKRREKEWGVKAEKIGFLPTKEDENGQPVS